MIRSASPLRRQYDDGWGDGQETQILDKLEAVAIGQLLTKHDEVVNTVHDGVTGQIERADRIHDNIEPVERGGQGCCHFAFVFNKQQAHEIVSVISGAVSRREEHT